MFPSKINTFTPTRFYSAELRGLLASLLAENPLQRPSCARILGTPIVRDRLLRNLAERRLQTDLVSVLLCDNLPPKLPFILPSISITAPPSPVPQGLNNPKLAAPQAPSQNHHGRCASVAATPSGKRVLQAELRKVIGLVGQLQDILAHHAWQAMRARGNPLLEFVFIVIEGSILLILVC